MFLLFLFCCVPLVYSTYEACSLSLTWRVFCCSLGLVWRHLACVSGFSLSPFGLLLACSDPSFSVFAHVLVSFRIIYVWAPSMGACAFLLPLFLIVHFVICFSDVLMPGIWNEVAVLEDPSLRTLVLLDLQMGSRASSSVTKYKSGWLRWRAWASSKIGVSVIPAKPLHIAFFFLLRSLLTIALRTIWVYPL